MRISRLYIPDKLNVGQQIDLKDEGAHYLRTVLRLKKDHLVTLFNGLGGEYQCTIEEVSRNRVSIIINQLIDRNVESPLRISLGLGISRRDRMDWAIQKAVELGVNEITPIMTERCVCKFKKDKKLQRLQHWKNIVQHATEQCSRTILPELKQIENFQDWLLQQKGLSIFLDPYAEKTLTELTPEDMHVTILSGTEGGFTPQEKELAIAANFIPVRLGSRILRTETASLAALSAVQMLWGDFV